MRGARSEPWRAELDGLVRALAGAFVFGMPLLYTLEMWQIGAYLGPGKLLLALALALLTNLGLAHALGYRREHNLFHTVDQAVTAVVVGLFAAAISLLVLNRFSLADGLSGIMGKIVLQAVPLSLGASVANGIFDGDGEFAQGSGHDPLRATLNDVGATAAGALFIAMAIAPTDEIALLTSEMQLGHQLALIALSLLSSYWIVFASGFHPTHRAGAQHGFFQRPATETVMSYLVSLGVALLSLYVFDRVRWGDPLPITVARMLVLGLPATVGGAAGRLVV